jgi:hypothetical protein
MKNKNSNATQKTNLDTAINPSIKINLLPIWDIICSVMLLLHEGDIKVSFLVTE